jgi:hypothetical protein
LSKFNSKEIKRLEETKAELIRNPVFVSGYTCSSIGPYGEEFICEEGDICEYIETDNSYYDYYSSFYNHTKKLYFNVEGFPVRKPTSKLLQELFS